MKKIIIVSFLGLFLLLMSTSCDKDQSNAEMCPETTSVIPSEGEIVLGKKLDNPYSLQNMRRALSKLNSISKSSIKEIKATHIYARFAPKDEYELDMLSSDTSIFFYPFPLDYEIEKEGNYYQDPDIPEGNPTFQYCVFKIGQPIPTVKYEVLDSCFILEETNVDCSAGNLCSKKKSGLEAEWEALESIALDIVGMNGGGRSISKKRDKWTPSCKVSYYDDVKKMVLPVVGVPVRCRFNLMVSHQCCTDDNGCSVFKSKKGDVDYLIHWQRKEFKIRPYKGLNEAVTKLKTNTLDVVDVVFYKNSGSWRDEWKFTSIFNAVYTYYYGTTRGLSRPNYDDLKIRATNTIGNDNNGETTEENKSSYIHIFNLDRNNDQIYATVVHELTHITYRYNLLDKSEYIFYTDPILLESWCVGVEKFLATDRYPNYKRTSYSKIHTNIISNLLSGNIGGDKQTTKTVSILELEKTIKNIRSWYKWKDNLKTLYDETYIDNLFDYWEHYTPDQLP